MFQLRTFLILAALSALFLTGFTSPQKSEPGPFPRELEEFAEMLIGEFSSREQAERDTSYYNIHLSMSRIWEDRTDAIWLYVEQAMDSKRDKPYRQRVYKLTYPGVNSYMSEIYTITNPEEVVGLQHDPAKKALLTFDRIQSKSGCDVILVRAGNRFGGGTFGTSCPSDLRGASYATTTIELNKKKLVSWDRGYDSTGKQVWGATKGGYVFLREG